MRELYWRTKLEIHDIITLKDSRMLERYFQSQWSDTKYAGRVWICREIVKVRFSYFKEIFPTTSTYFSDNA